MERQTIDTKLLAKMIISGAASLDAKRGWINELNVFPVPDGDTGTNMCMTILSAVREMESVEDLTMERLSKAISSGSLRGARGNSGVILSQLMRGFAKTIADCEELDKIVICESFQKACETAYKAVMKPKEGTILTVAKAAADKALTLSCDDSCSMEDFIQAIIDEAAVTLARTPELLPVLKEAGVVDAGGQGLLEILKGAQDAFLGKEIDYEIPDADAPVPEAVVSSAGKLSTDEITFGYCTEFIINLQKVMTDEEESEYRAFLNSLGDSIVLVAEDEIVKTHVHTNDPGLVLQKALSFGSLSRIKIDNMREEHEEKLIKDASRLAAEQAAAVQAAEQAVAERKEIGFIAVSIGAGINEVFTELGADYLIEGGQTMNPSTEDMLEAIAHVNADTVFIFPNNKNIILAANQAADLEKEKQIVVIPTTSIPQGVTALINFVPGTGVENNRDLMTGVIDTVKTGQVTYAVRDTMFHEREIHEGDYMGIGDKEILSAGQDMAAVAQETTAALVDTDSSFICVYYGEEIAEEDAQRLGESLRAAHPTCEVEVQNGGQPIYYYIISVE